jgi:hypothetical protein
VATYFSEYDTRLYPYGLLTATWVERPAAATFRTIVRSLSSAR